MTSSQPKQGLKALAINGAVWTMGGFAISQMLRLASSLILSRFLAPEHFGLIAIVTVFMIGLGMFSDIGIGPNIIQSNRGFEKNFLNTAWTVQVIRGYALWLICIIAAYPLSLFYAEPQLLWLIPVSGFSAVISGHSSTGIFTTNKKLDLKKQTMQEIFSQMMAIVVMVTVAYIYPSVWALVAGSLFSSALKTVLSHQLDKSVKNTFHWDKGAAQSMVHFGGWVLISTMLGFFVNTGSSLILAKFVTMSELGLFSMGVTLAKVVEQVFNQINNRVVMPTYSQIKHLSNLEIRSRVKKIRLALMAVFLPPLWILVVFAQQIVGLLFDARYQGTAWVLQLFAVTFIPVIVSGIDKFYLALGDTQILAKVTLIKAISYFVCLFVGWLVDGGHGMIYGIAINNALLYFVDTYIQHQYEIWLPDLDVLGFAVSAIAIWLGFYLTHTGFLGVI